MFDQQTQTLIANELTELKCFFADHLHSEVATINEICQHVAERSGKQIRAKMVILVSKCLGYQGNNHVLLAAIVELLHAATLLHDDVIDQADTRRHQQAAHHLWGNTCTILGGDYLYGLAFQNIAKLTHHVICQAIASATTKIIEGEILQLTATQNHTYTEDEYFKIIEFKTAKLFEVATYTAALLASENAAQHLAAAKLGHHLGMAFQILDDLKDYFSTSEKLGKPIGGDLAESKITLPVLLAMPTLAPAQQQELKQLLKTGNKSQLERVVSLIVEASGHTKTHRTLMMHVDAAQSALASLPTNEFNNGVQQILQAVCNESAQLSCEIIKS